MNACDHWTNFQQRVRYLTSKLVQQQFSRELLRKRVEKYYDDEENVIRRRYKVGRVAFVDGCFEWEQQRAQGLKRKRRKRGRGEGVPRSMGVRQDGQGGEAEESSEDEGNEAKDG